jgi:hypothetical protein
MTREKLLRHRDPFEKNDMFARLPYGVQKFDFA